MFRKMILGSALIGILLMTSGSMYSADASVALLTVSHDSSVVELTSGCCAGCPPMGPCKTDHKCYNGSCVEHEGANCSPRETVW